jgi:hypothetical protein
MVREDAILSFYPYWVVMNNEGKLCSNAADFSGGPFLDGDGN